MYNGTDADMQRGNVTCVCGGGVRVISMHVVYAAAYAIDSRVSDNTYRVMARNALKLALAV